MASISELLAGHLTLLGQVTEKFRDAVKAMAERQQIPVYHFSHKEGKDDVADQFRRERGTRGGIVFVGMAQEKAKAYQGKKIDGQSSSHATRPSTSTTTTSTLMMPTSARCSSRCAAMRRGGPSEPPHTNACAAQPPGVACYSARGRAGGLVAAVAQAAG